MIRAVAVLAATSAIALATPALAQDHSVHHMPGMKMPAAAKKAPAKKAAPSKATKNAGWPKPAARTTVPSPRRAGAKPATSPVAPAEAAMPGMDHSAHGATPSGASPLAQSMDHSMHDRPARDVPAGQMDHGVMSGMKADHEPIQDHGSMHRMQRQPVGTARPAGNAPAPKPPMDHYADRQFPVDKMARSREAMMHESGGQTVYQVMFNIAEYQARNGRDGYRWDGEAWFGGDVNRLTLKSEGEGRFRGGVESAEVQALYSRAIGPYFNLQAGLRHDFDPGRPTTYATVGVEGLAPYWFEVEGAAFLSDRGDVLGRLEGYYDQRITQRLVMQPRVELNLAAQNVPETRTGAGWSSAELGLRLRYDISRKFSPYVGVSYEAKMGQTARYARSDGDDPTVTSLTAGIRFWF